MATTSAPTEPTPEQRKALVAGVFDRAAPTYDQVGVDFFGTIADLLVRRTAPSVGDRVLDLGCGRGASALRAARAVGRTGLVQATDLAPAMVDAVRTAADRPPWLVADIGDAEDPPPGPWDVVQAGLVLFFLPDLDGALDRYRDVLSPGGRLGFTWFGDDDPDWKPVFDELIGSLPEEMRPAVGDSGPFTAVDCMHAELAAHGFTDVDTVTETVVSGVVDVDHWWRWTWSQGYRFVLEHLQARRELAEARERVDALLRERMGADGLRWRTEVHCTLARP